MSLRYSAEETERILGSMQADFEELKKRSDEALERAIQRLKDLRLPA